MATIAWLVPGLLEGSGGHRTILQHADHLQNLGHKIILYMENKGSDSSNKLRTEIKRIFGFEFDDVRAGWQGIEPCDMIFATIWYSAKVVSRVAFPCVKCYFVQDYEAWFNPVGDTYLMAENSYRFDLHTITIGKWLPAKLNREFGINAHHFDFCADLDIYRPLEGIERENAVCFIYQPDKPRRCQRIGIEALGIVKQHMPEVKIYLYGSRLKTKVWYEHTNLGLIDLESCNRLYNSCKVGLCISSSNPSRIPFEMMAAGLPVVEIHRDNTLYDFPNEAMLLCEQTPEAIASGLIRILSSEQQAEAMSRSGSAFMTEHPIEQGLNQFSTTVQQLLDGNSESPPTPIPSYIDPPVCSELKRRPRPTPRSSELPDNGRLAFLPPKLRSLVRFFYHRARRMLP